MGSTFEASYSNAMGAMRHVTYCLVVTLVLLDTPDRPAAETGAGTAPHVVLDGSLDKLRADFNAKKGTIRLMFIVDPVCPTCVRGLVTLNDEFLASNQNPRLNVFVVHVPMLGARERHVAKAKQFLTARNTTHYWDGAAAISDAYQKVLGIGRPAWDVWFVFGPDATWDLNQPPTPDLWMHQLFAVQGPFLDPKVSAKTTVDLLTSPTPTRD